MGKQRDGDLWQRVKTDFLTTGKSYAALAQEYGVSISTLKKIAAREGWAAQKTVCDLSVIKQGPKRNRKEPKKKEPQEPKEPAQEPSQEPGEAVVVIETKRDRLAQYTEMVDAMAGRIREAIEQVDPSNAYALGLLARALRELRDLQGFNKSELDLEEQRARIEKLRSETRIVDAGQDSRVLVEFVDTEGAES